ncbi:MAG: hypothetical protein VKS61_06790 [Candidatus Sericytochromatia bacterium]|nr:hypothetical protein [Candidatus Sericytochromatia bacterium]
MLVPRPCGVPAKAACTACHTACCPDHLASDGRCLACDEGRKPTGPAVALPAGLTFDAEVLEAFEVAQPADPDNAWSDLT